MQKRQWAKGLTEWPLIMNQSEVAAILQVTLFTVREWRRQGRGPICCQLSQGNVRYLKEDVLAWLYASRRTTHDMQEIRNDGDKRPYKTVIGHTEVPLEQAKPSIAPHLVFRSKK